MSLIQNMNAAHQPIAISPTRLPRSQNISHPRVYSSRQSSILRASESHASKGRCTSRNVVARMGIKFMENFEAEAELDPTARKDLEDLLANPTFCGQVATETRQEHGISLEYTGLLFQPVPWSPSTQKGMPAEFEKYHNDPLYVTINIPPNFMFQAKIFKPSRLCAFYKRRVE